MQFANGEIGTSPDQGTAMTVATYQQGADLVFEWGDTSPFNYEKFIVRWDKDGSNVGQRDIFNGFGTRGLWFVPLPVAGTYSIIVEGCDVGQGGSTCRQGWTVPVTISYIPPQPPLQRNNCYFTLSGPILNRWMALGGRAGPLGCPVEEQHSVPGTHASVAAFGNGQILLDPDRGTNMTVVAYQVETDIAVEWGPTNPFSYDDFNILWTKDGVQAPQAEVDQYLDVNGNQIYPGPNNHGIYSVRGVGPGIYTVSIEGCDKGTFHSTCRQGWTVPVTVRLCVPGSCPAALDGRFGYHAPECQRRPSGIIGEQWSKLVGTNGPLLGCPKGIEQPIPGTTGVRQDFDSGEMAWSPDQGQDMVVALYQQGSNLVLSWGDSFPFSYDKFIVRVTGYPQIDYYLEQGGKISGGNITIPNSYPSGAPWPTTGNYSAVVEGCDTGIGGSTCNQSWTIPVTINFVTPSPPIPFPPVVWDVSEYQIDFSKLTPATTAADAQAQLVQRGQTVAEYTACRKTLGDVFMDEESFMEGVISKLNVVSNGTLLCDNPPRPLALKSEVNSALRFQQIKSKPGSSSTNRLCTRTGEYDVALTGYITILERFSSLLDNDVRSHIANDLLNLRGPLDTGELTYCNGISESENHLNMMESARYLTNQILYEAGGDALYDNEANGMNQYILSRLQTFLQRDFLEYNSKPYQTYTDNALQNLFDFAEDRRVKMGARLVLDYISAKYAASSNSLRRDAPYRRRVGHYSSWLLDKNADAQNSRFTFLSGMFQINSEIIPGSTKLSYGYSEDTNMLAVSTYHAPGAILDLLMNPARRNFYQRIHHDGVEIYSSRPDYLITAGGYWMGSPYTFLGASDSDDDGPAVRTTLMPTGHLFKDTDMIRIDGFNVGAIDTRDRINTCVAPDFACGINPVVPDMYMKNPACFHVEGAWTFVDFSSPSCNDRPYGFYAAVFIAPLGTSSDTFGFFEAFPRDPYVSFYAFWNGVLDRNGKRKFTVLGPNTYTMTSGAVVQFLIAVPGVNKYDWPIVSTGNPVLDQLGRDISQWPLASGDILNSPPNSGLITFDNPSTGKRIILDFTDSGEPKETQLN